MPSDSKISTLARESAENPNEPLLSDLRELEKQMKLVYTMVGDANWSF